jgi:hypothetical protein
MSYIEENEKGQERLRKLVSRLSDEQLALPAGEGWTVAAILAHLAFWDYRALVLLERWKKTGVEASPIDSDAANDGMKPLCLAIPDREAAKLVVEAAEAIDAELEHMPEDLRAAVDRLAKEGNFRPNRSNHRNEHLDQIEKIIAAARS